MLNKLNQFICLNERKQVKVFNYMSRLKASHLDNFNAFHFVAEYFR